MTCNDNVRPCQQSTCDACTCVVRPVDRLNAAVLLIDLEREAYFDDFRALFLYIRVNIAGGL